MIGDKADIEKTFAYVQAERGKAYERGLRDAWREVANWAACEAINTTQALAPAWESMARRGREEAENHETH